MSLRTKVVVPLVVLAVVFSALFSYSILDSLETNIVSSIASQIRGLSVLSLDGRVPDLHREFSPTGESTGEGGYILVRYDSAGVLLFPQRHSRNVAFTVLPERTIDIPLPDQFRDHPYAGIAIPMIDSIGGNRTGSVLGILLQTRSFQRTYNETRIRLLLFSLALTLILPIIGSEIVGRMTKRLDVLRGQINAVSPSDRPRTPYQSRDVIATLSEDILITQQNIEESRKEIARLQIVRSQFLANVSHEVRTPLFLLKGFLETLLNGGIDDPEVNRAFLGKSLHQAQRIDNLLRDLIEIARIESGEMRMSFRYFNLSSLFDLVRQDHADLAQGRGQSLALSGDMEGLEVVGDKDRLRQALSNLVENAMKYSPEGTTVTLTVEKAVRTVRLSVSDSGPGIPAEHLGRIFERFYRIDPDRSRELGGTGLGLAIVKHIVEAHGSEVVVRSEKGRGTTFSFDVRR